MIGKAVDSTGWCVLLLGLVQICREDQKSLFACGSRSSNQYQLDQLKKALAKLDIRPLESSVFNDLCKEVKMLLEMDPIPRFVRDPLYEEAKALLREARCISENAFELASGLSEREWRILTS